MRETRITGRRQFLRATAAATALAALPPTTSRAQAPSTAPVRILYGFPAGSSGDIVARRVAERIAGTAYTDGPAIVENKPGAGGRIALEMLKQSHADGRTLALSPFSCASLYPHIYQRLGYDPVRDLVPVSIGALMFHGFAVGPAVPVGVTSLGQFLDWAKAHPEQATYGSPAAGSTPHFIGALLGLARGVDLKHVPYRGSMPGITDLVGGQIAAMATPSGDFIANYKAGKLRVLATSGSRRSPFLPDVPTFAEQGFPELTVEEWFGFYAPAGVAPKVVASANAAINQALGDKAVADSLAIVGLIARGSTPQAMADSQRHEFERWGPLIKRVGFTAES